MVRKIAQYRIQGMNRDISESVSNADKSENLFKYAYEIKNMRVLTNTEDNTTFSLVNEKGTKMLMFKDRVYSYSYLNGTIIGAVPFNDKIVVFIKGSATDIIAVLSYDNDSFMLEDEIYRGHLNFNTEHPIEAITCYENDSIQKVYWTDGLNSPRMINICLHYNNGGNDIDHQFDFTPYMSLNEKVTIEKLTTEDTASFTSGTIQYILTYSNRYAQETNPFYISPLYYNIKNHTNNSELDRGGRVDELCVKPFKIRIEDTDQAFELIHIYSIQTTEQNTRLVQRIATINNVTSPSIIEFIDTNRTGEILDINEVAFLNEKWALVVQTINHKDNRLFAGNVETTNPKVSDTIKSNFRNLNITYKWKEDDYNRVINLPVTSSDYYPYNTQLDMNSFQMKTFKSKETYRFGVQLQDKTGKWSEAIFINDVQNPYYPHYIFTDGGSNSGSVDYYYTYAVTTLSQSFKDSLIDAGFVKIRPVVVFPSWAERETACQGLLCPTVYSTGGRMENTPYAQSSWFVRPNAPVKIQKPQMLPEECKYDFNNNSVEEGMTHDEIDTFYDEEKNVGGIDIGFISEFRHNAPIPSSDNRNGEMYCNDFRNTIPTPYGVQWERAKTYSNHYVDQSLVTLHSPELEFDSNLQSYDLSSLKFRVIGVINWTSNRADIQLQSSTTPNNPIEHRIHQDIEPYTKPNGSTVTSGFKKLNPIGASGITPNGYKTLISGPFWFDYVYYPSYYPFLFYIRYTVNNEYIYNWGNNDEYNLGLVGHVVYPFHKQDLNNWDWSDPKAISWRSGYTSYEYHRVVLNSKNIYNARYSIGNNYFNNNFNYSSVYFNIGDIKLYNGNTLALNPPEGSDINKPILYYGGLNRTILQPTLAKTLFKPTDSSAAWSEIYGVEHHITSAITTNNYTDNNVYYDYHNDSNNTGMKGKQAGAILNSFSRYRSYKWGYVPQREVCCRYAVDYEYNKEYGSTPWLSPRGSVNMQYNSTNHAVIVINNYNGSQMTLPTIKGLNTPDGSASDGWHYGAGNNFYGRTEADNTSENYIRPSWIGFNWGSPFWADNLAGGSTSGSTFIQPNILNWKCQLIDEYSGDSAHYGDIECGWSLIGELYREVNPETRFGGTSEAAMESNIWYIAGEAIRLDDNNINKLRWTEGDTYFQRYDHLKTYSPANVQNGIVDVASFMVETRINLDGRCDINRGRNYFGANNTNFNLMNMAYTQDNNMFTGHTSDSHWLNLDKYPNQVIWSTVKNYGEKIDSWCNLSLITALDFDGNRGVIRKIERFANELIVFQDNAISKINYNQNVQIATSTGTPIQIANSNAIEGKVYLTTSIGTRNKWSIVNTPTGIYFIDYSNIGIYKFNGQGMPVNLTDNFGFRSFMIKDLRQNLEWNPKDFSNLPDEYGDFVGYYDNVNGDVFYINKKDCIAFNDKLNIFTSFYSYENTPYFVNLNNLGVFFKNESNGISVWLEHKGEYGHFFEQPKEHSITLIANPNSYSDKVYDNVEFRSDVFDNNNVYMPEETFTSIRVWNEHQDTEEVQLHLKGNVNTYGSDVNIPSNLKKKFRTWRIQIPRDKKQGIRNRIRNPWTYIKLTRNILPTYKHVLHDIIVDYFE